MFIQTEQFINGISVKVRVCSHRMLPLTAGARRWFINLSAKLPAIFIKEGIYVDNSGLEYYDEVREDNVLNVVYVR